MDTALPQKFPFILDRNLAKANYTGNRVCTLCDIVVLDIILQNTRFYGVSHTAEKVHPTAPQMPPGPTCFKPSMPAIKELSSYTTEKVTCFTPGGMLAELNWSTEKKEWN